jgi:hypothetical protein
MENQEGTIKYSKPIVTEKSSGYFTGFVISVFVAILLIFLAIITLYVFSLTNAQEILLIGSLILFYLIISPILMRSRKTKEIRTLGVRTVEKPVEKKVYIKSKPIIKRVVVNKNVYVAKNVKRAKLNIPRFAYVGSTQTKHYHTRNCRLGKLIKNKYKEHSNTQSFFKKRGYNHCKMCIKNKK